MSGRPVLLMRFALPLFIAFWAAIGLLAVLAMKTQSQAAEPTETEATQIVGLVPAPPFAMRNDEGDWEGIAVDLWRHVADQLGLRFEFQEIAIPDLAAGLQQGRLIAVATATASADHELVMELSHPYYSSGLAIAVPVKASSGNWFEPLGDVVSGGTVKIAGVLLALLLVAGVLAWLSERRANPEHFSPRPLRGIADGLWWAAVTLTTVGYGDKAPTTRAGRVIGVIWMFAAVVLIALFTAQVTSSLTVTGLRGRVRGPADLVHVKVGAIQDSQPQTLLRTKFGVRAGGYPGFREGLEALEKGEIDAFVAAEPVLRYEIANTFAGRLAVVGSPFLRADYVFAFPPGSAIRKQVNYSILSYIETDGWRDLIQKYLGSTS